MKRLFVLLLLLSIVPVQAAHILWVGVDENAQIHDTLSSVNFLVYLSTKADAANIGGRIRIGDEALPAGYEDPPDQNPPAVSFYDDVTDFGLFLSEETEPDSGIYVVSEPLTTSDWQPIKLPDGVDPQTSHVKVYYDIGYWDEANDWNFVKVATAVEYLDVLYSNHHIYEAGTLAPPIETPWRPVDFYTYETVIPEPSTGALFLLGTFLLFRKNRTSQRT